MIAATSVSACIIARDEERVLARCLASIRGACDEVCVVDTGSVDRTREIAARAGARIVRFTRCNDRNGRMVDFALARNRSLDMAHGDWVLWIDADEVLQRRSVPVIRRLAAGSGYDAVNVQVINGRTRWPVVRMFRRRAEVRFVGVVHEWPTIYGEIRSEPRVVICNLPDKKGKETSVDRDLRLCRRALRRDPGEARFRLYLARALEKSGKFHAAIAEYTRYALAAPRFRAGRHHAHHRIAVCHLLMAEWRAALMSARRALDIDDTRAESHCVAGNACLALGRVADAAAAYRAALACPAASAEYPLFTNPEFYSTYPRAQLRMLGRR